MRFSMLIAGMVLLAQPALATSSVSVPEMDIGAGFAAVALLVAAAALIRERSRRK